MNNLKQLVKRCLPAWIIIHKLKRGRNKRVLLTFDDGPDERLTPHILDILQQVQARAVFFVIGEQVERHSDLLQMIVNQGHLIANHTYSHPHEQRLNLFQYRIEIKKAQKVIYEQTGSQPRLFRPPCGTFNLSMFLAAKSLGMKIVLWSNGGGEWSHRQSESADEIALGLKQTIRDGQIVLLHDNNEKIPAVLKAFLPFLQEQGYDLGSAVSEIC